MIKASGTGSMLQLATARIAQTARASQRRSGWCCDIYSVPLRVAYRLSMTAPPLAQQKGWVSRWQHQLGQSQPPRSLRSSNQTARARPPHTFLAAFPRFCSRRSPALCPSTLTVHVRYRVFDVPCQICLPFHAVVRTRSNRPVRAAATSTP